MLFELVTFAKIKLHHHPPYVRSVIIRSAMTHSIFVGGVGKLGGGMWL